VRTEEELVVTSVAVGGAGVSRERSGRVVLVEGALPGERVRATLTAERRVHARAQVVEVVEPSPDRVAPPCPLVAAGCGGCGWQHVAPDAQPRLKAQMVADALRRTGGIAEPVVDAGAALAPTAYRTTLRCVATDEGRAALRRRHSHDLVPVPECLVVHPLVGEILAEGRFPPGSEITIRVGARTGERLVVVDGPDGEVVVPPNVRAVHGDELAAGRRAWIHEEVAGRRLRVSARSFFQAGPDGAEALVAAVSAALGDPVRLADLYGGVGLFAATLGAGRRVELVEASASACADARVNLAGTDARVVRSDVARWRPRRVDAVVADPPRAGLGRRALARVTATRAERLVLVSCDAGALARDVRLLGVAGYRFVGATLVDMFPQTPHVEVVSRFDRAP